MMYAIGIAMAVVYILLCVAEEITREGSDE